LFRSLPPPPTPTLFPYNDALPIFRRRDELGDRQRPAGRQRDARIVAVEERGVHGRPLGGIVELCRRDGRQGERADARRRDAQLLGDVVWERVLRAEVRRPLDESPTMIVVERLRR